MNISAHLHTFVEALHSNDCAQIANLSATIEKDTESFDPSDDWGDYFGVYSTHATLGSKDYQGTDMPSTLFNALNERFENLFPVQASLGYGVTNDELPCQHCNSDGELDVDDAVCDRCVDGWVSNPLYCADASDIEALVSTYASNQKADMPKLLVAPIYTYEHGGVAHSLGGFGCQWDSGVSGFVYALADDIEREFGTAGADETLERWIELVDSHLSELNDYLSGECYSYSVNDKQGLVDESCGGFIGNEGRKAALEQIQSIAEAHIQAAVAQRIQRLKSMIRHRVPSEIRARELQDLCIL